MTTYRGIRTMNLVTAICPTALLHRCLLGRFGHFSSAEQICTSQSQSQSRRMMSPAVVVLVATIIGLAEV